MDELIDGSEIERKLEFAYEFLKPLFGYTGEELYFVDDPQVKNEGLQRILIYKGENELDEIMLLPADYFRAGMFVGRILHMQVNPLIYRRYEIVNKRLMTAIKRKVKDKDLPREFKENRIFRRMLELASGRAVAEEIPEDYVFDWSDRNQGINSILDQLYQIKGKGIITDLARLIGIEGRVKILNDFGVDISPGQEQ